MIPADSTTGQVQTVAAKMWYLETAPGYKPHVRFGPYENIQFPMKGYLHTRLAHEHARKFVRDRNAGPVELQAIIVFDGHTYQENSLLIPADDILNSNQALNLHGPAGEAKVGRRQEASILREARIIRGIGVGTEYDDPDFSELVATIVQNYTNKEVLPMADWDKIEAFFEKHGWDPNDFKADLIEAGKYIENKEARDQFHSDISKSINGSGSFGIKIFSGSASFSNSSTEKITKDVLSKWGLQTEFQGKKFIPKSIDVNALNTAKIRQTSTFAVGKRKKIVSDGVLTVPVNSTHSVRDLNEIPVREKWREALAKAEAALLQAQKSLKETEATRNRCASELKAHQALLDQSKQELTDKRGLAKSHKRRVPHHR
jgi:hypothetical protein